MDDFEDRMVRAKEFAYRLGLSKSMFYQCVQNGQLPQPLRPSPRCTVWPNEVVREVLQKMKNGELDLSLAKIK